MRIGNKLIGFSVILPLLVGSTLAANNIFDLKKYYPYKSVLSKTYEPLPKATMVPGEQIELTPLSTKSPSTGNIWTDLYKSITLPKTSSIIGAPAITFNNLADGRIISIALKRGYELQNISTTPLESLGDFFVQPQLKSNWLELKKAAYQEGIILEIVSGFRSIDKQRALFLERFDAMSRSVIGREYTDEEIASGKADTVIDNVLKTTSIPGFSRHHSGYAIDIEDVTSGKKFTQFENTAGYIWISKDNFYNSRKFGFIPSYPKGSTDIGPNPEAWEFIWVGVENIPAL